MFPDIELLPESTNTLSITETTTMGRVFLFDFDKKQYVIKDGKPVEANYEQAIKQWISLLLFTESDAYEIYKGIDFGVLFKQFIGRRDVDNAAINSEVKRQIEEKIILHPEILGIENFIVSRNGSEAIINFSVVTKNGIIDGIESKVKYFG